MIISCSSVLLLNLIQRKHFNEWRNQNESLIPLLLIMVTVPTTTSAVTVILIVSFAVSCWRLFVSLRAYYSHSISITFSLSFSFLCCLLVLYIDTPTAILNACLLFHMHLITPIRYIWYRQKVEIVEQLPICYKECNKHMIIEKVKKLRDFGTQREEQ